VTAAWGTSETGRKVRLYKITRDGIKQLEAEAAQYDRQTKAIQAILRTA
jgi:DNA-binding PadR family transcriptional regulator